MSSSNKDIVQVDGAVLLQLIRHYQEYSSSDRDDINGFLVGVTVGSTLEVTHSIPYPSCTDDDQGEGFSFESEYVSKLQALKLDDAVIGIYQSVTAGDFINRAALENLFQYQYLCSDSILLIYDPTLTAQGKIGLRAYRLQPEIFQAFSNHNQKLQIYKNSNDVGQWEHEAATNMSKINFNRLYFEIPVVIYNSPLVKIMMHDMADRMNVGNNLYFGADNTLLDSNNPGDIESNLKQLLSSLDAVHDIQYNYHRKLAINQKIGSNEQNNKDLVTSRLDIALASGQLSYLSNGIAQMAGQTVGKLMLSNSFYTSNQ